ncbi:efflux RND transporter periplasmic adaptor subunit [Paucihalobacter ruber]|uniref:Efflux RND transporter periplasmic adaptor subunit n=1 Tax=Paucihalobacter ruber TaxID=2567861 RepID=A0A506PJL7_9FLAO|nr:efflux RND transporter periplasmic adaptor subunit [Paucihalobacter ruber]TPV33307.1 efflux RND transporter periplasmic adaptor subunit [Paucihalobacter ruber]
MKHIYITGVIITALLLSSCGGKEQQTNVSSDAVVKVEVLKVDTNNRGGFLSSSGTISAVKTANLSTRNMGYVDNIYVSVGEKVAQGQLLLSINNVDLQAKQAQVNAQITEATAAFTNAEKDYNRFKNLFADNSASQKELDDITAHYNMAKARLEAANQMKNEINAQFAYVNIKAPFSGVVTGKFIEKGNMANPGMTLLTIENPEVLEIKTRVPESQIAKITEGMPVTVLVKSLNKSIDAKITEVSASSQQTGGQFLVTAVLNDKPEGLKSGMFATVNFPVESNGIEGAILIPVNAVVNRGQLTGVYTVSESNTSILRWLRLGRTFGNEVEVLSGLQNGESLIVNAESKLYNGASVIYN